MPDFRRRVDLLVKLLGKASDHQWRTEHTECLNGIMELSLQRIALGLADTTRELELHVDEDGTYCSCNLVQEKAGEKVIIAMAAREF